MEEPVVKKEQTVKEEQVVKGDQVVKSDQVVTNQNVVKDEYVKSPRAYMVIWYILGLVEVLLVLRLILKLLGAGTAGGFVNFIYAATDFLIAPFQLIFNTGTTTGLVTTSVLEPATIIAMVIYALIIWGISKLIDVIRNRKHTA